MAGRSEGAPAPSGAQGLTGHPPMSPLQTRSTPHHPKAMDAAGTAPLKRTAW